MRLKPVFWWSKCSLVWSSLRNSGLNIRTKHTVNGFSCFQMVEIRSLLKDENELVDWRQFLLSAALPWPLPSLPQLLAVLQRFRAADTDKTGYVTEEQFLQVCSHTQLHIRHLQLYKVKTVHHSCSSHIRQSCGFPARLTSLFLRTHLNLCRTIVWGTYAR